MEFFGLTSYGSSSPIKDMMRSDYQEPEKPPQNILDVENKFGYTLSERIKELDCYIGFTDGYAYRSWDRLTRMRRKSVLKPVGPTDMYKYPGINSMDYGWWNSDPDLSRDWYKPRVFHSQMTSEMSRFYNHCLKVDKYFKN
ncbi:unnamed protein product [Phaedon cochleariae]|uniref:Uncharacterized protein n=1 Tax=Phaedon cochleariae TaxID=80249 RepID=A0A9P0DYV2_PHACE|nr:unnamed protein product [Phaedon cochleariae]